MEMENNMLSKLLAKAVKVFSIFDGSISHYAAGLSFYSILSMIPLFWVLFFILQQLGILQEYYDLIKSFIVDSLIPNHAEMVAGYLDAFLNNANNAGSMGLFSIFIASIMFYRNFQYVVNKIFGVPSRRLIYSMGTYLVLAVVMPSALGLSFYLSDYLQRVTGVSNFIIGEFTLLSYLMIWLLFFVLYKVSPNIVTDTKITLKVTFVVSVVWHMAKWMFVQYTLVNQTYTTLYGSFSALLFLLVWIYLSWLLLLQGMKVSYLMHKHKLSVMC